MAGQASDFKVYQDEYQGGQYEYLAQNITAFNEASRGALRLVQAEKRGDYAKEAFFKRIPSLVTRRNTASQAAATELIMTQDELISVKVNRKIGPVGQTIDSWKKIGASPSEFSFQLGKQVAEEKMADMVNTAILAVETALQNAGHGPAAVAATIQHGNLVDAMAILGDKSSQIVAWVMHSKVFHDLMKQSITDKIFGVANVAIYDGTIGTFGKPTIVIDSPALLDAGTPNTYNTLGLVADAASVTESEEETIMSDPVLGQEQIKLVIQGEYAYNVGVKGFKWDVTNGGAGPTDAAIGTATNWDSVVTSVKNRAGVRLVTQ